MPISPTARASAGAVVIVLTTSVLNRHTVGRRETQTFRVVNELPDRLFVPTWAVMQGGTIGAAWIASALSRARGHRRLAVRLFVGGTLTWALSKVIKRVVRRPRPGALIPLARIRGAESTGLGYVSGHAGVALALAVAAWPHLPQSARFAVPPLVATVGIARVYVGAHLPLDVVGGFALGLTLDALVEIVMARPGQAE